MYPQQHPTSRPRLQAYHRLRTWRIVQLTRRPSCWRTHAQVMLAHAHASACVAAIPSGHGACLARQACYPPSEASTMQGSEGAVSCIGRRRRQAVDLGDLCPSMAADSCAIARAAPHCLRNGSARCHPIPTLVQTRACRGCRTTVDPSIRMTRPRCSQTVKLNSTTTSTSGAHVSSGTTR